MKSFLLGGTAALALAGCATTRDDNPGGTAPDVGLDIAQMATDQMIREELTVPDNVLLADWTGPYDGVPPWDRVTPELFPKAIQFGIDEQRREVVVIANNPEAPTFANTVEALEKAGQRLDRVLSVFGVMTDNMTTPAYQALEKEWSPKLAIAPSGRLK